MSDSRLELLRQGCLTPLPQPAPEELRAAIDLLGDYVLSDYQGLPDAPVGITATRPEMESLLREAPPELGTSFPDVLKTFQEKVAPYSLRPHHPRFLAFVPGAPTFVSILGDWLCAGMNFFAGVWKEAPAASQIEILVLDWFKQFLRYPDSAAGVLTSGGSEANLIALVTARESVPVSSRPQLRAYVCNQRHYSIDRAFMVLGLDRSHTRPIEVDNEGRMDVADLRRLIAEDRENGASPWLVVANAGATNTGAVDPISDIAAVCRQERLWLHVDAAYGWPAVLTEAGRETLAGIELADSLTLDPHKWFAQPFEAGCVLIRDGKRLPQTFQMRPEYLQDVAPEEGEVNFSDHGIALTRRFRALKIWLSIKVLGVAWFRRLVEHCCTLAAYAEELIRSRPGFEIVSPASLSIVCYRYLPQGQDVDSANRFNLDLCERVRETGRAFLSTTRLGEIVCLRFCFVNYRTTAQDVEQIIDLLETTAECM